MIDNLFNKFSRAISKYKDDKAKLLRLIRIITDDNIQVQLIYYNNINENVIKSVLDIIIKNRFNINTKFYYLFWEYFENINILIHSINF